MTISAAFEYVKKGFSVFPVYHMIGDDCSCRKWNCKKGKHPRITKWQDRATTDINIITEWWNKWPHSNIGIVTGHKSNLVVIDIDPRNGGDKSLQNLIDTYPNFKHAIKTHEVSTGGNGSHFYFKYDKPFKSVGKHGLGRGIDVQADGKYIVAPPSNHESGGKYSIINDVDPQPLPQLLIDLIGQQKAIEARIDDVMDGNRNAWLAEIAGQALRDGMPFDLLVGYLQEKNIYHCKPPKDFTEVEVIAESIINGFDPAERSLSFKTRWQNKIIESKQSASFTVVCITLSMWMDQSGRNCYPSQDQISSKCGIGIKTVRLHLKKAEELGYLNRYKHSRKGRRGFNYGYTVILCEEVNKIQDG